MVDLSKLAEALTSRRLAVAISIGDRPYLWFFYGPDQHDKAIWSGEGEEPQLCLAMLNDLRACLQEMSAQWKVEGPSHELMDRFTALMKLLETLTWENFGTAFVAEMYLAAHEANLLSKDGGAS